MCGLCWQQDILAPPRRARPQAAWPKCMVGLGVCLILMADHEDAKPKKKKK